MYQLRTLINHTSVPTDPSDNMNASEDFLLLILHAQTVAAAKQILLRKPHTSVSSLAKAIVEQLTYFDRILPSKVPTLSKNGVQMYAIELFTLSL